MKKILIVACACIFAFPIFGCSNKVEFVGEKDLIYSTSSTKVGNYLFPPIPDLGKKLSCDDGTHNFYNDYSKYYNDEIKEKTEGSYYLLKTNRRFNGTIPQSFEFCVYDEEDDLYTSSCIYLDLALHEKCFENPVSTEDNAPDSANITLSFVIKPIKKYISGKKFSLEFGKTKKDFDEIEGRDFFNVYYNDEALATCYYKLSNTVTKEPLTYEWVENYLQENLVYMG